MEFKQVKIPKELYDELDEIRDEIPSERASFADAIRLLKKESGR